MDGARLVPCARITLLDTTGTMVAAVGTDEADRYVIDGLTGGEYTAVTSGYLPTVSTLHIGGWERTVRHDVELRRAWADAGSQDRHGQLACPGPRSRNSSSSTATGSLP